MDNLTQNQKHQISNEIFMQAHAYAEHESLEIDSNEYCVLFDFCYCLAQVIDGKSYQDRLAEQKEIFSRCRKERSQK